MYAPTYQQWTPDKECEWCIVMILQPTHHAYEDSRPETIWSKNDGKEYEKQGQKRMGIDPRFDHVGFTLNPLICLGLLRSVSQAQSWQLNYLPQLCLLGDRLCRMKIGVIEDLYIPMRVQIEGGQPTCLPIFIFHRVRMVGPLALAVAAVATKACVSESAAWEWLAINRWQTTTA